MNHNQRQTSWISVDALSIRSLNAVIRGTTNRLFTLDAIKRANQLNEDNNFKIIHCGFAGCPRPFILDESYPEHCVTKHGLKIDEKTSFIDAMKLNENTLSWEPWKRPILHRRSGEQIK